MAPGAFGAFCERPVTLVLSCALLISSAAHSQAADICYGPNHSSSDCAAGGCTNSTSVTIFNCPMAGSYTLIELAQRGWLPIKLSSETRTVNFTTGNVTIADRLLLRRRDALFTNGFE